MRSRFSVRWDRGYSNLRTNSASLTNWLETTFGLNFNPACGYRIGLLVEEVLILELKSVDKLTAIHEAQLLTYMKLANVKTGLLINFNVTKLKDGIKRFVF